MLKFIRVGKSIMKHLINKIKYLFWIIFLTFQTQGQGQEIDQQTYEALNNYVKYVNQNINTLQYFHGKFKRFNLKLNQYFSTYPKDAASRIAKENEGDGPLIFADSTGGMSLSSLYEQTISTSKILKKTHQVALNKPTDIMMKVVFKLVNLNNDLDKHIKTKKYLDEPQLQTAYEILNQVRLAFHEFTLARDDLEYELKKAFKQYQQVEAPGEVFELHQKMLEILETNKQVVNSLKKGDIPEMQQRLGALLMLQKKLEAPKKSLKQLKQTNKARWKLLNEYYENYFLILEKFQLEMGTYTSSKETVEMKLLGKSYIYYNDFALPNYNELVSAYDEWLHVSGQLDLNRMEEVPWFRVLTPQSPLDGAAPNNLIFLLDVSASMNKPDRLPLLQAAMKQLLKKMRPYDRIAIITYSGRAKVALPSTAIEDVRKIERAIDNLKSNGETNAYDGLKMAYDVLSENFIKNGNNRILLATDGYFTINNNFTKLIEDQAFLEKRLSVFYFGDNELRFKPVLENLSKLGKGNYIHVKAENVEEVLINEAKAVKTGS